MNHFRAVVVASLGAASSATLVDVVTSKVGDRGVLRMYAAHFLSLADLGGGTHDTTLYGVKPTKAVGITSYTAASPSVITTDSAHGLSVGDVVAIANDDGDLGDGIYVVASVPSGTTLTLTGGNSTSGATSTTASIHKTEEILNTRQSFGVSLQTDIGYGPHIGYYATVGANTQVNFGYRDV